MFAIVYLFLGRSTLLLFFTVDACFLFLKLLMFTDRVSTSSTVPGVEPHLGWVDVVTRISSAPLD